MDSYQEKIALLQEMIAFALVDGEFHDREYDFLEIVSKELEIEKETFLKLSISSFLIAKLFQFFHNGN